MHNTLKLLLLPLLCILCSCSHQNGFSIKTETISTKTDTYMINCESFNVEGSSDGINELNGIFDAELTEWEDNFVRRAEKITTPGSSPPCLQVRHTIKRNDNKILSVVTEKYVYLTGLHGNTWASAKNYDAETDKILTLSDLFTDDAYPKILNERIDELIRSNPETYHDLWETPCIDQTRQDKFYLDDKTLVIFYEPYELSYYARGVVEFPIPIEEIRGYIKSTYLE